MKSLGKFTPRRTREKTDPENQREKGTRRTREMGPGEPERRRDPENQRENGTQRTREKTEPREPIARNGIPIGNPKDDNVCVYTNLNNWSPLLCTRFLNFSDPVS